MALRGYAGALRFTMEANSALRGRFMHPAQWNVSNPEAACKGGSSRGMHKPEGKGASQLEPGVPKK